MKGLVFGLAVVSSVMAQAIVLERPASVVKTGAGWEVTYVLPAAERVNHLAIEETSGAVTNWTLHCDQWEMLAGGRLPAEMDLPHEHVLSVLTLAVGATAEPAFGKASLTMAPYPDALDPARVRRVQEDANTVYIDLGRDTAVAGVSYPAELGRLDAYCSWEPRFSAQKPEERGDPIYAKTSVKGGETVTAFHDVRRFVNQYRIVADRPIAAEKIRLDVRPYGWRDHLTDETWEGKMKRLAWWQDARFGLFVHFGLYARPARHEWIKTREKIPEEKYQLYFDDFNPDRFDAKAWAKAAKAAGMKYAVLTTKHHEGFCLWDSKVTDYKITNTPFGRDLVREFVEAFRAEGLRVGFYYSLLDWHHPDFTIDDLHPRRKGDLFDYTSGKAGAYDEVNRTRDMAKYRQYMKDQVRELLTNYGKIDIIWYDFSYPHAGGGKTRDDWDSAGLLKLTKSLQKDIIIDNRLDLGDYEDGWDFMTPEQNREASCPRFAGREMPWETCQTFSGSWGYHRDETSWKSAFQCIEQLVHTVAHGGNVIMNVGPTARGEFDARALERLADYGRWMDANGRSIYGCGPAPAEFVAPPNTLLTYNPKTNRLYVHVLAWHFGSLPVSFGRRIRAAKLLNDDSEIQYRFGALDLPVRKPDVEIPVIEVYLKD